MRWFIGLLAAAADASVKVDPTECCWEGIRLTVGEHVGMNRGWMRVPLAATMSLALILTTSGFVEAPVPPGFVFGVSMQTQESLPLAEELSGYGRHPMMVRVPIEWSELDSVVDQRIDLIREVRSRGWMATANLRYQPATKQAPSQYLSDFSTWVSEISKRLDKVGGVAIEIANRPNSTVPDPRSDSAEPLAVQALVTGVVAAWKAAPRLEVGFSWLATGIDAQDAAFWSQISALGGRSLPGKVSFVSVHLFPGSLSPGTPWAAGGPRGQVRSILEDTRQRWLPMTDLGRKVDIRVGEFGAPFMPKQPPLVNSNEDVQAVLATESGQVRTLQAIAGGVVDVASYVGVSSATWTALTDDPSCFAGRCWGLRGPKAEARASFSEMAYQISRTTR